MKKLMVVLSLIAFMVAIGPRKAQAQVLEGALIGAAVGGAVGLFLHFMKPKTEAEPALSEASGQAEADSSLAVKPVFLPGSEVVEEAEPAAN